MSKSLGNVVDPVTVIRDAFHGDADPLRYFLLRTGRLDADGHFDLAALKDCYHRELVGTLGNLVSRVFKSADVQVGVEADIQVDVEAEAKAQAQAQAQADSYAQTQTDKQRASYAQTDRCGLDPQIDDAIDAFDEQLPQHFANVRLPAVADCLQSLLAAGNAFLSHQQPWRRLDAWPHCRRNIRALLQAARPALEPLAPGAAAKIDAILQGGSQAAIPKGGIFPRLPR